MTVDNKTNTYAWGSCWVLTPFYDGGINTNIVQVGNWDLERQRNFPKVRYLSVRDKSGIQTQGCVTSKF